MKKTDKINLKSLSKIMIATAFVSYLIGDGSARFVLEKYNTKNIFNNKNLKVSEEEANKLYQLLEEESGNYNLEDERDLILTAAIENPNLTESEKKIIFNLVDLIEEVPYVNKRVAYANLKNLTINYCANVENNGLFGYYDYTNNEIIIYYDNENHDILMHELIHSIFINVDTNKLPKYFSEGVTELLEDEYFDKEPYWESTSYPYEITMVKILCDMVGSDLVLEAYTTGDMKLIEDGLAIHMTKEEAKSYLKNIKEMFEQYDEENTVSIEYMSNFLEDTNTYFNKRYFKSSEVYKSYEYNKELLINMKSNDPGMEYIHYLEENGYYAKPYFSKKLKEKDQKHYQKKIEGTITVENIN